MFRRVALVRTDVSEELKKYKIFSQRALVAIYS
jgi:hypothetical protein